MTNAIETLPDRITDAGLGFNYQSWSQGTVLTLVNVPWNNDYRDVVKFASPAARDAWIDQQENALIENMSYGKFQQNVKIEMPLNAAARFNYLRAENPLMPIAGDVARKYYYFIIGVEMMNPSVTQLTLQLDVFQTYGYEVSFGSAYVERGHIGIANSNAFNHFGRDYLLEPEGFDAGSEYRIVHTKSEELMAPHTGDGAAAILICSTADLTVDPGEFGTKDDPAIVPAKGSIFENMPTAAAFYLFKSSAEFGGWLAEMADRPWVIQSILSVTMVPDPTRYHPGFPWNDMNPPQIDSPFYDVPLSHPEPKRVQQSDDWRNSNFITNILGARYSLLKKFLTSPYLLIELTTWTGSPVIIRPEMWQDANATVTEMCALVPPGQRIAVMPYRYNWDPETNVTNAPDLSYVSGADDNGEFLDMAAVISQFPQLPIIADTGIAYLAQNRNSLNWQNQSAEWSQQRAIQSSQTGYDQANAGIAAGIGTYNAQQFQRAAAGDISAQAVGAHGVINSVGSLLSGSPVGAAQGAANALVTHQQIIDQTNLGLSTARRVQGAQVGAQEFVRDSNRGLAQWAARGDYANTIANIQARVQDARMNQPSAVGQFNGDAFNLINGRFGYSLRWKMLNLHRLRAIGDVWLRFGYAVNRYVTIPTSLMVMEKFTYWKLQETYISQGAFPEGFKQIIRGIFEKGVTVWADPDFIGTTDWADNEPLTGVSY